MLVVKKFKNELELLSFLRGSTVVVARTGENSAASSTFTDSTGTPFADVLAGDELHISGDSTIHVVSSVTDDNNIEVAPNIAGAHVNPASFAVYRILRDATPIADVVVGPQHDTLNNIHWVIYDEVDFG